MAITISGTTGISGVDGSAGTPAVQGTDTNTGVFYPAADTVGVSTAGAERMRIDSSGNLQFNSGYGSVATAYGCRAWVNFNGTGTVAIRASGNVTSITDNGVGLYTVNFTNAMSDVNYAWSGSAEGQNGMGIGAYSLIVSQYYTTNPTTSALAVGVLTVGNNLFADSRYVDIAVFR